MNSATLRPVLESQQSEDDMRAELLEAARIGGWTHLHIRDSRGQDVEDYPDDWFLRGGEMVWWELKTVRGKVSRGQERMLSALQAFIACHGLEDYCQARVVRPADLADCLRLLLRRDGLPDAEVA